jgi:hypothetical protein
MTATTVLTARPLSTPPFTATGPRYSVSIGYLRAFLTLLVVAHHAALAYHPFAPPPPAALNDQTRIWPAFPLVDPERWNGFALLVGFNDIFFMALMFFISGLFVWQSLERKGAGSFLRDRTIRLGLPFLVAAGLIAPLAYYPTYLQTGGRGVAGFWQQWSSLGNWPAGPAWFVWLLLAFDGIAGALFLGRPAWGDVWARISGGRRPAVFFGLLVCLSAAAYVPPAVVFNPYRWSSFGPFFFQTSRGLNYLLYFLLGVGVGAYGIARGLLAPDGRLARRWPLWCVAALVAFGLATGVGLAALTAHLGSRRWEIAGDITFVISCAASSLALLALFVRFARTRRKIWDSLTQNAYGIYLIHYAFVSWLQLALLKAHMDAMAKGALVFLGAVLLGWGTTAGLRRIPAIARVI